MGTLCSKSRQTPRPKTDITEYSNQASPGSIVCPCPCTDRKVPRVYDTEMMVSPRDEDIKNNDKPRMHESLEGVLHAGGGDQLATSLRPLSWPHLRLDQVAKYDTPSPVAVIDHVGSSPKTKNIFINIERTPTPKRSTSPAYNQSFENDYCVIKRVHDTYTLILDEDIVKDVYLNYERIRSHSL